MQGELGQPGLPGDPGPTGAPGRFGPPGKEVHAYNRIKKIESKLSCLYVCMCRVQRVHPVPLELQEQKENKAIL